MKRLAVAFSGPSNSGKTTTILKVVDNFMSRGLKCAVIKHDPSDKANFDVRGKDSYKFSQTGADVVVLSPTRTTYFSQSRSELDDVIKMLGDFDLLIVEGLKTLPLPRISVFKDEIDESYLSFSNALASYQTNKNFNIPHLNLDDINGICEWIEKNAKVV
ncbi:MAG: molybdopterin-guanine dinucleotide biosynthesis protein B [Campylobacter sp.]|nr:molybdopterin-guanine dinucleotide biosynthesis protein B [Campylobacter sp.]